MCTSSRAYAKRMSVNIATDNADGQRADRISRNNTSLLRLVLLNAFKNLENKNLYVIISCDLFQCVRPHSAVPNGSTPMQRRVLRPEVTDQLTDCGVSVLNTTISWTVHALCKTVAAEKTCRWPVITSEGIVMSVQVLVCLLILARPN